MDLDDTIAHRTTDLLGLADVHRWNVMKSTRSQSVAEHSFNVAVIVMELCQRLGLESATAVRWSLLHDAPETLTGDIDGKFKVLRPEMKEVLHGAEVALFPWYRDESEQVSEKAQAIVKLADKVEATRWIATFGIGGRANAVVAELRLRLIKFARQVEPLFLLEEGELPRLVLAVLDHSTSEEFSVQFRLRNER